MYLNPPAPTASLPLNEYNDLRLTNINGHISTFEGQKDVWMEPVVDVSWLPQVPF